MVLESANPAGSGCVLTSRLPVERASSMEKDSDEQPHHSGKWRQEFAKAMREEREQRGLTRPEYPQYGRYQEDIEKERRSADLSYLLRLIMWFRDTDNPLPSPRRLRALLILWALARLEAVPEGFEFRKEVARDYDETRFKSLVRPEKDSPERVKEKYKKDIDAIFNDHWPKRGPAAQEYFQETLNDVYEELKTEPVLPYDPSTGHLPTLEYFPEAFKPLVVIVGGSAGLKPSEPEHISELFRQPQSMLAMHYFPRLGLDTETEIVSDRLLLELQDDPERAEALLGRVNLLVVGSPLVNAFSRHLVLNKKLIFNFVFNQETYLLGRDFYDDMIRMGLFEGSPVLLFRRLMDAEPAAMDAESARFTDISDEDKQLIKEKVLGIRALMSAHDMKYEDMTELFRPDRIFSPLKQLLIHGSRDSRHEYAVISLGENIWANMLREKKDVPRRALILVSGTHELSTSLAVRALSSKETLRGHPLGGVLDITKGRAVGPKYVTGSRYDWRTLAYDAREVLDKTEEVLQSFDKRPSAFALFEKKEELEMYREVVRQYIK